MILSLRQAHFQNTFAVRIPTLLEKPYITASPAASSTFRKSSAKLRVGISWWGGALVSQMKQRSIAFDTFCKLLHVEDIEFVNLQHGRCDEKLRVSYCHRTPT